MALTSKRIKASSHKKRGKIRSMNRQIKNVGNQDYTAEIVRDPTMSIFRTPEGDVLTVHVPLVRTHTVAKIMELINGAS